MTMTDDDDGQRGGNICGGELALSNGRNASSSGCSSFGESTSDGDYDEPPSCRVRTGKGNELPRWRASMKQEEDSD